MARWKWRWEYIIDTGRHYDYCVPKRWRLLVEDVAAECEAQSFQEALNVLPEEHPALAWSAHIFRDTRDRFFLVPWRPFTPSRELLAAMGVGFVERIQAEERDIEVWGGSDGWVWLHMPGDRALA